jgi:type II secretory pathway pseudopilin PulG
MNYKIEKNFNHGGFTLLEVIVAVFIMVVAILGLMTLISAVVSSSNSSTARLAAANLAQEGIEVVKNIRDLNFNDVDGWDSWFGGFSGTTCYLIQYNSSVLNGSNQIGCANEAPILKYDAATGLYGYTKPDSTAMTVASQFQYRRTVIIIKNPSGADDNEIKVSAQIVWTEKGRQNNLTVEDRLWRWRSY